jgi:hypothetical protein
LLASCCSDGWKGYTLKKCNLRTCNIITATICNIVLLNILNNWLIISSFSSPITAGTYLTSGISEYVNSVSLQSPMLRLALLITLTSSGCSHGIQFVQILHLWNISHFRTKGSECVNMMTSQFTADAAVGPFLQVDVLTIFSLSSFIPAGTSGTKDSVNVNMVTS